MPSNNLLWAPTSQSPSRISDPALQFLWDFGQGGTGFLKGEKTESKCEAQDEILLLRVCRPLSLLGNIPPLGDLFYEISITYSSNPFKKQIMMGKADIRL